MVSPFTVALVRARLAGMVIAIFAAIAAANALAAVDAFAAASAR